MTTGLDIGLCSTGAVSGLKPMGNASYARTMELDAGLDDLVGTPLDIDLGRQVFRGAVEVERPMLLDRRWIMLAAIREAVPGNRRLLASLAGF